ncbi:hypothetical protein GBAR_LOCUS12840 [Geodia barretti]|uniref:Uncharacterized protein n=1 Tax=Geodia barretti TaxID=519541 RepID=A0AA35S1I9_GEOBA|nr:hypothetical protein GBAR_LOCUS12840 [Geodia barretti]
MGNAGGFSSAGPSTPAEGSTHNVTHGDGDGHRAFRHREMNKGQLQEMSRNLDVSKTEIQLLWQRFLVLGPGEDGALDRAVFQRSPYDEDIFCRQVLHPYGS